MAIRLDLIASKLSKVVGIIARLWHFVPKATLLSVYNSLFLPYLSYGITTWGLAAKILLEKLLILQKCVLHLINLLLFIPMQFLCFSLQISYQSIYVIHYRKGMVIAMVGRIDFCSAVLAVLVLHMFLLTVPYS